MNKFAVFSLCALLSVYYGSLCKIYFESQNEIDLQIKASFQYYTSLFSGSKTNLKGSTTFFNSWKENIISLITFRWMVAGMASFFLILDSKVARIFIVLELMLYLICNSPEETKFFTFEIFIRSLFAILNVVIK